jgi:hypothetical protein
MGNPATREFVSKLDCPAVPLPRNGTAGQSSFETTVARTVAGTDSDRVRKIALRKLAFLRDRQRDNGWDNGDERPVPDCPTDITGPGRGRDSYKGLGYRGLGRARARSAANTALFRLWRQRVVAPVNACRLVWRLAL